MRISLGVSGYMVLPRSCGWFPYQGDHFWMVDWYPPGITIEKIMRFEWLIGSCTHRKRSFSAGFDFLTVPEMIFSVRLGL